ncbi:MAG: vitamin K epoxide reductase family protein [Spartobacteria bacterium]
MANNGKKSRSQQVTSGPKRPSGVVYWIMAGIALLGLADATFLTVAHLTGDDAVCGSLVGCSTVLGSRYATILGIPTAMFGALAYFTAFSLAILAASGYEWARRLLVGVVGVMFLASLYFLYLQAFVLHAFCPFCLFSAAVTFFLAGLLLVIPSRR